MGVGSGEGAGVGVGAGEGVCVGAGVGVVVATGSGAGVGLAGALAAGCGEGAGSGDGAGGSGVLCKSAATRGARNIAIGLLPRKAQTHGPMTENWVRRAVEKKRDGEALPAQTWRDLIAGYASGAIDEAPIAALAMACTIRGMDEDETVALTEAMVASGETIRFALGTPVVDKHSSGGVGDTVSLVAVPVVAACGVPVAKLSGRALGHTGGTLDKLEAIPGVRTDLSLEAFVAQVERIGCAIAAQSARLVPADRQLYALRDRTATVPCIGLIAASMVSKKIAAGADAIVFDVKCGRGAFMKSRADAFALAERLVALCGRFGRRASALISDMSEPLASRVGTGLEAIEAREVLRGAAEDARFHELVLAVCDEMLRVCGRENGYEHAREALASGAAYERFVALIEAQGGTRAALEGLRAAEPATIVAAPRGGVVDAIDAVAIGEAARDLVLACGPAAGVRILARTGATVAQGAPLAEIFGAPAPAARVAAAFSLGTLAPPPVELIAAVVRDAGGFPVSNAGAR